jgi:transposase
MSNEKRTEPYIERVDDLPLLFGLLQQMRIQAILDEVIRPHGNWQGLSPGWVISMWLIHILSEQNHCMEPVQQWVGHHLVTLQRLSGQEIRPLDFSDDRLALCLQAISKLAVWGAVEAQLGATIIRVYRITPQVARLDATVATVSHDPEQHPLFQVGKAKNGQYETQFKLMLASLDPLGLPLVVDVTGGQRADDPLYIPSYQRLKQMIPAAGLLIVGDSKMDALATLGTIVSGGDGYLTPLAWQKNEPELLANLLAERAQAQIELTNIFLPEDVPDDGREPEPALAIAYGFESSRLRQAEVAGQTITWTERLLVIRSYSYIQTMQQGLQRRLAKAEAALNKLTPPRAKGKQQITNEASLLQALAQIEKKQRVAGLFNYNYDCQVEERQVRAYKDQPARTERRVRYQLTVSRNEAAIAQAEEQLGWRIYGANELDETDAPLTLTEAVLTYRDQYLAENNFRRLKGKFLSITPVYVQRDDHAQGLFHLLSIGARLLALGDYQARQALAEEGAAAELSGVYRGNAKRGTGRPTTERMLKAFEQINLLLIPSGVSPAEQAACFVTPLSPVQERILGLLGLSTDLYTTLQVG